MDGFLVGADDVLADGATVGSLEGIMVVGITGKFAGDAHCAEF